MSTHRNGAPASGFPVARSACSVFPPSDDRSCDTLGFAVSPVVMSSSPAGPRARRQPEWRPVGFSGSPATSGSFSGDAVVSSSDRRQVFTRMSTGRPFSMCDWQVENCRLAAKSGWTSKLISPDSPRAKTSLRSALTRVVSLPRTSCSRPDRSVTSIEPSGRKPRSHGWSRPRAIVSTCSAGVSEGGAGAGEPQPLSRASAMMRPTMARIRMASVCPRYEITLGVAATPTHGRPRRCRVHCPPAAAAL